MAFNLESGAPNLFARFAYQPLGPSSVSQPGARINLHDLIFERDSHFLWHKSSQIGHHYGNPTNHFWNCLHQSGLTSSLLDPRKDYTLPQEFSIGLTNLVNRPTIEQSELSKAEQIAGVPELMKKIIKHRPRITCFVGLGIADIVKSVLVTEQSLRSRTMVGLQPYKVVYPNGNPCETLFYAVSSTSGRVVRYQKADKIQQFTDLHVLVEKTRNGTLDTEKLIPINMRQTVEG